MSILYHQDGKVDLFSINLYPDFCINLRKKKCILR